MLGPIRKTPHTLDEWSRAHSSYFLPHWLRCLIEGSEFRICNGCNYWGRFRLACSWWTSQLINCPATLHAQLHTCFVGFFFHTARNLGNLSQHRSGGRRLLCIRDPLFVFLKKINLNSLDLWTDFGEICCPSQLWLSFGGVVVIWFWTLADLGVGAILPCPWPSRRSPGSPSPF